MFARLAQSLAEKNETEKAIEAINKLLELFPDERIPLTFDSFPAAEMLYFLKQTERANELVRVMAKNSFDMLEYYFSLPDDMANAIKQNQNREMSHIQNLLIITKRNGQNEINKEIDDKLKELIARFENQLGTNSPG